MNGIHDMGGMHGFGRVKREEDYTFNADWQRRAFGLTQALASIAPYTADSHRQAVERLSPADYLRRDYFEKWVMAVETLLLEAGIVSQDELNDGQKRFDVEPSMQTPVSAQQLRAAMEAGVEGRFSNGDIQPKYSVGDRVHVLNNHPPHHNRTPRYVKDKLGTIISNEGYFHFADAVAQGRGPAPQFYYTIAFSGADLWGADAKVNQIVHVDLWESYIESA